MDNQTHETQRIPNMLNLKCSTLSQKSKTTWHVGLGAYSQLLGGRD
jgi:hypothetical protein